MMMQSPVPRRFTARGYGLDDNIVSFSFAHDMRRIVYALFPVIFITPKDRVDQLRLGGKQNNALFPATVCSTEQLRIEGIQSGDSFSISAEISSAFAECSSDPVRRSKDQGFGRPQGGAARSRGRPRKIRGQSLVIGSAGSSQVSMAGIGQSDSSNCEGGQAGRYFTRAKKALLLGKVLGVEFPGSDLDAIRGLEEEFRLNFPA